MADLENDPLLLRQGDQLVRLGNGDGDRLFDQHMDTGCEKFLCHGMVVLGRHHHADSIDHADQLTIIVKGPGAEGGGNLPRPLRIAVRHADQFHIRQLGVFLGMEVAQVADADDRSPYDAHPRQNPRRERSMKPSR